MKYLSPIKQSPKIIFIIFLTLNFSINCLAQSLNGLDGKPSFKVPNDWLGFENETLAADDNRSFEEGTDLILKTQQDGLDKYKKPEGQWHLFAVLFDLGVTIGGRLGVLLLQGTPGVWLYWHPKPPTPKVTTAANTPLYDDDSSNLELSNNSELGLRQQIHDLVQSVYATGKVTYNAALEDELFNTTSQYFSIMDASAINSPTNWGLQQMRLDLQISAAGRVHFASTLGGAIRLRMHWTPQPKKPASNIFLDENQAKIAQGISKTLTSLLRELEIWSAQNPQKGFQPAYLRVGLGVLSNFNVGLVRGGAHAILHAYFIPQQNKTFSLEQRSTFLDKDEADRPNQTALQIEPMDDKAAFASALGIQGVQQKSTIFEPLAETKQSIEIPREVLQKGLNRAGRMGRFFLQRAQKLSAKSKWELFRVKINLDINAGGSIGLATLTGDVQLEECFNLQTLKN